MSWKRSIGAALSTQVGNPDPAKFVPVEQIAALQADFNALKTSVEADNVSCIDYGRHYRKANWLLH